MFTNMSKFNAKVSIYTTSKYSQELVQTYSFSPCFPEIT